jgi:ATP-dependent DNA ligase
LPTIAEAVRRLPAERALVDGEGVAFRPDGHSDLAALRTKAGASEASFVYRQRPLEERREALSRMVAGVDGLVFSAEVALVFARACDMGRVKYRMSLQHLFKASGDVVGPSIIQVAQIQAFPASLH